MARPGLAAKPNLPACTAASGKGYGRQQEAVARIQRQGQRPRRPEGPSAPWQQITITPLDTCGLVILLAGDRFQHFKREFRFAAGGGAGKLRIWSGKKRIDRAACHQHAVRPVAVYLALPGPRPLVRWRRFPSRSHDDGFTRIDPDGAKMSVATGWKNLDGFRDLLVERLLRRVK